MSSNSTTLHGTQPLPSNLVDQAAGTADHAIKATQRVANHALDGLADGVESVRKDASPMLSRATERAAALAQRGADAVRDGSRQLADTAQRASEGTVNYVRGEPVKALLIAAAAGAALMALVSLVTRSHDR
jgi:ElaB/YqjD/DUF883 family membrane-anchored ribosome-binding protein